MWRANKLTCWLMYRELGGRVCLGKCSITTWKSLGSTTACEMTGSGPKANSAWWDGQPWEYGAKELEKHLPFGNVWGMCDMWCKWCRAQVTLVSHFDDDHRGMESGDLHLSVPSFHSWTSKGVQTTQRMNMLPTQSKRTVTYAWLTSLYRNYSCRCLSEHYSMKSLQHCDMEGSANQANTLRNYNQQKLS